MKMASQEYILLTSLEQKTDALRCSSCLLSLNAIGLSLAVDACRLAKCFEMMLEQWQQCLPLGDANDVNFASWGNKIWEMMQEVRTVYSLNKLNINLYEYETESYLNFKSDQELVGAIDDSLQPFASVSGRDVADIVMCALRELNEVLMEISEFLNSPTEELIVASFEKWSENYRKCYHQACKKRYEKWKIQYTARTLKKNLQERMDGELADFRAMFVNDDEFELVYDSNQNSIDLEGISRFLFSHADRFGVSHIDDRPMFSKELLRLFNFLDIRQMIQTDLQPKKRPSEKSTVAEDDCEQQIQIVVGKLQHFVADSWRSHLPKLWQRLYRNFRSDIVNAGPHEKFRGFSKKTVYCIIGHLKSKGIYQQKVSNAHFTRLLEGTNNGMRKYLNNGLIELEQSLGRRIEAFIDKEILALAAV